MQCSSMHIRSHILKIEITGYQYIEDKSMCVLLCNLDKLNIEELNFIKCVEDNSLSVKKFWGTSLLFNIATSL